MTGLLPDYSKQAETYDRARSASAPLLARLQAALDGAPGTRLADVGGGTGNYALALQRDGWDPVVIDRSPEMLAHASRKGLATRVAEAASLPFDDASFDAAMLVAMLHHVADPAAALSEARRVVRPRGRIAVVAFTREDIDDLWPLDYFPSTRPWMQASHAQLADLLAQLPGAEREQLALDDLGDATLAALAAHPEKLLDARWRKQTSYFERLEREDPNGLAAGLRRLARDVSRGAAPARPGLVSILAWSKPAL